MGQPSTSPGSVATSRCAGQGLAEAGRRSGLGWRWRTAPEGRGVGMDRWADHDTIAGEPWRSQFMVQQQPHSHSPRQQGLLDVFTTARDRLVGELSETVLDQTGAGRATVMLFDGIRCVAQRSESDCDAALISFIGFPLVVGDVVQGVMSSVWTSADRPKEGHPERMILLAKPYSEALASFVAARQPPSALEVRYPEVFVRLRALLSDHVDGPKTCLRLRVLHSFTQHGSFRQVAVEQAKQTGNGDHSGPAVRIRRLGEELGVSLTRLSNGPGVKRTELTDAGRALAEWITAHPELLD